MTKKRIILVLAVCFSIAGFAGQALQQIPPIPPRRKRGMTLEEHMKEVVKWHAQRKQQNLRRGEERINLMMREAWKRLLRVTERQWKIIEPKCEKVFGLYRETRVGALGSTGSNEQSFHWDRWSKGTGGVRAKAPDEMTEGQRIADELIDLLENENAKDEEIRRKIDALQQAREKAKKELTKAKQELKEVITTPRQEAVFLLMGYID